MSAKKKTARKKTAQKKSAKNSAPMRDAPNGGKLRSGNLGGRGGTGRPPNEFKQRMQELASQKNVEDYLRKCLRGDFGPKFYMQALQYATDHGYGKAVQAVEHSGPDGKPIQTEAKVLVYMPDNGRGSS